MKNIILSSLVIALLPGAHRSGAALADSSRDVEPLAVVSLASYDQLFGSVELAGKLAGRPKLAKGFQGMLAVVTHGKGLAGLDKARPWGMIVEADGSKMGGYAFLPVDDFQEFREVIEPHVAGVEDLGDGVYEVQGKRPRQKAYLKQKDDRWLFVCDKLERLANTPDNPAEALGELPGQYDLAVRLNVSRLPAAEREKLVAPIRRLAERDLEQRPGEVGRQVAVREMIAAKLAGVFFTVVQDLETLTFGWSLNEGSQRAFLDVEVTAKRGSKTADALDQLGQAGTRFAGFRLPGAAMTCNVAATCPYAGSADLGQLFSAIRAQAFEGIDKGPSERRAEIGKDFVGGLLEVIEETVASGRADGAMSLVLDAEAATFVSGRYVADGPKLEKTLRRFVEAFRREYPLRADEIVKTDVAELEGVRLHTLSIDVSDDAKNREQLVRLVGERLDVAVGTAEEAVYLAAGKNAMETLKEAIRKSAQAAQAQVAPIELSIALGDFAALVAETGEGKGKERAMKAVAARATDPGKDHLRLAATPIRRGVKLRLELEENALRMIEAMHKE